MKLAVLGVGTMGSLHARLLRDMAAVEELLVADADLERARQVAGRLGIEAVADPVQAIDRVEAVVVAAANEAHPPLVRAAIERGVPVLCEKPLAPSLAETIELVRLIEDRRAVVQAGFQRRFDAGYLEARRLVASGELGRLLLVSLIAHDPAGPRPGPGSDRFRDSSIHDFDLIRWLSGSEVTELSAMGADRDGGPFDRERDPDTAVVAMTLADGSVAQLTATRVHPLGYDIRTELVGSRDAVCVGLGPRTPERLLGVERAETGPDVWQTYLTRFEAAYAAELQAFLEVATGSRAVPVTARDDLEATRLAAAARTSLRERRPVGVAEVPGLGESVATPAEVPR